MSLRCTHRWYYINLTRLKCVGVRQLVEDLSRCHQEGRDRHDRTLKRSHVSI